MTTTTKLKKYYVSEQVFLNWECEAIDKKHAKELYSEYISTKQNAIDEFLCAFESQWDDQVNVEEVRE